MDILVIVVVGSVFLSWLAFLAGTQADTRAQRRERARTAFERRLRDAPAEPCGWSARRLGCGRCPFR